MNKIKISEFIKLTGSTLKTINYYHKIGLLPEPERSLGGYRLYGPVELKRMLLIKRLKSLGMGLKDIKEIMGDLQNPRTSREVLQALHHELLNEKKNLEERLAKIDTLLNEDALSMDEDIFDSPSFQMITEILGTDQIMEYARTCPDIYDRHRKIYGILDDLQWGEDYRENFRTLAEYFKTHPEKYQQALEAGARMAELSHLSEDDPRIEALARDSADLVKNMPPVKELICNNPGMKKPFEGLYQEMVARVLSPASLKYQQLFKKFLLSQD